MRPLELRVRNFRSYAGEHVFDFRERRLVGIVGPIGSGKSSILDAIAFALYGRTPRIGSATKTLINQRAADASVVLQFVVEGELWEVARSIRIKGQSKHALYRYDDIDQEPVEKLLMEGEVNERIVSLLGLDFSAFERSVLLAQGRFAEFLQARPADRDKVLKGVFGHDRLDRMKALAKEHKDKASNDLDKLTVRLERFDEIKARLAEARLEVSAAGKRKKELETAAKRVSKLEQKIKKTADEIAAAVASLAGLEEHAGRLPDPAATARLLAEVAAAEGHRKDLATQLDEAQQRLAVGEKVLAESRESGEPDQIRRAADLLAAAEPQLKAVVEADRRIASLTEGLEAARDQVARAREGLAEAELTRSNSLGRSAEAAKILEEAQAALQRGRHADMAATLRSELIADEHCPVCDQPVHELPETAGATHIEELEAVAEAAQQTKGEVGQAHASAIGMYERSKEQLQAAIDKEAAGEAQLLAAKDDSIRLRGDLEETTLRLDKILGSGDPAEQLEERRKQYEALVAEREAAQRRTDQVRGIHDQSIRDEQEIGKVVQDLGVRLTELATRLEMEIEIGDDAAAMGAAVNRLRDQWMQATADLTRQRAAGQERIKEAEEQRLATLSALDVAGDIESAVAVVVDRIDRLGVSVQRDQTELEQAADLYEQSQTLADQVDLFSRINSDLTDSRFVRFLLDEERSRLAELGSEHFEQLSSGRYRFAGDQFAILDLTAADVTRRADSLSGGETFLASLGLALALAEMVAGTGGRLDAFFLDEGFGTLDPEHLDLAMEGIEQLVANDSDRLVVIVSHVPELRMRIEDLIELERNPVTGDTRVLSQ